MTAVSFVVAVTVTLLTPPTDRETLFEFYRKIHPAGFWRPVQRAVMERRPDHVREKMFGWDMFNRTVGAVCLFCLNMMPSFSCCTTGGCSGK